MGPSDIQFHLLVTVKCCSIRSESFACCLGCEVVDPPVLVYNGISWGAPGTGGLGLCRCFYGGQLLTRRRALFTGRRCARQTAPRCQQAHHCPRAAAHRHQRSSGRARPRGWQRTPGSRLRPGRRTSAGNIIIWKCKCVFSTRDFHYFGNIFIKKMRGLLPRNSLHG